MNDKELIEQLGVVSEESLNAIVYVQRCIEIYEQTKEAMGETPREYISQSVSSSQLTYNNPKGNPNSYVNVSKNY